MKKYEAIIIDDERNVREALAHSVRQNCPEINICGTGASAEEGRKLLEEYEVTIIFLDISMPRENGFEFLRSIEQGRYCIIFTTAYQEYALQAIKANAIDYLLKPVNPVELREAVGKALAYHEMRIAKPESREVYGEALQNLYEQVVSEGKPLKKIMVAEQYGFRMIHLKDLKYLEADTQYTILYLRGSEQVVSSKSIGEYEKILTGPEFIRIHKSTIINLNYLKEFSSYQGNYAVLDDNTRLMVSRRRLGEFKEKVIGF